MMDRHLQHVKNNMVHFKDIDNFILSNFDFELFAFDTESCTDKKDDNNGARVYAWAIGSINSDLQVYGNTLNDFYITLENLCEYHFNYLFDGKAPKGKTTELIIKIPVGVHNLSWDLEFLKYFLEDEKDFTYDMGELKSIYKPTTYECIEVLPRLGVYNITVSSNAVYGANFCIKEYDTETKRGKKFKVKYVIDLWDTLKVMTCSIDKIDSFCTNIDPMFCKLSDSYDYDLWRSPSHKLTNLELQYLYNDVYRLKTALEQFFIPKCKENDINPLYCRTASSLAFSVLKNITFRDNEEYIKYYEIGDPCSFEKTRGRLERLSYQGGYTHINKKIINKVIKCKGSSFDINSSYPSQMAYEPLPYGKPIQVTYGTIPKIINNVDHVGLIEIGFDYVKPKNKKFDLPIFKIGVRNLDALLDIVGHNVSGNEYFSTNFSDEGHVIPVFSTSENDHMPTTYNKVVTSVEYEFLINHYDFGVLDDNITFSGLKIGSVLTYKAETGKLRKFVVHFNKMKMLYKGTSSKDIKELYKKDHNYFNGILNSDQLERALKEGIKKDASLVAFAKLCLNSSYGKFGTKTDRQATNTITDEHGIKRFTTPSDDEYVAIDYTAKEFYRPVASFITAYGRLKIWKTIIILGVENFLYTDTDSIYCTLDKDSASDLLNKNNQFVDSKKLGYWDNEHNFTEFKGLSQKKYMLNDIETGFDCRCAGCPRDVQKELCKEGFEGFYLGRQIEGKKQKVKVPGGVLLKNVKFSISNFSF